MFGTTGTKNYTAQQFHDDLNEEYLNAFNKLNGIDPEGEEEQQTQSTDLSNKMISVYDPNPILLKDVDKTNSMITTNQTDSDSKPNGSPQILKH